MSTQSSPATLQLVVFNFFSFSSPTFKSTILLCHVIVMYSIWLSSVIPGAMPSWLIQDNSSWRWGLCGSRVKFSALGVLRACSGYCYCTRPARSCNSASFIQHTLRPLCLSSTLALYSFPFLCFNQSVLSSIIQSSYSSTVLIFFCSNTYAVPYGSERGCSKTMCKLMKPKSLIFKKNLSWVVQNLPVIFTFIHYWLIFTYNYVHSYTGIFENKLFLSYLHPSSKRKFCFLMIKNGVIFYYSISVRWIQVNKNVQNVRKKDSSFF